MLRRDNTLGMTQTCCKGNNKEQLFCGCFFRKSSHPCCAFLLIKLLI